jgi:hypothetical protein
MDSYSLDTREVYMDSNQRKKFTTHILREMQDSEKFALLQKLLAEPADRRQVPSEKFTRREKFAIFWGSTPIWAVGGMIFAVVASYFSLKLLGIPGL